MKFLVLVIALFLCVLLVPGCVEDGTDGNTGFDQGNNPQNVENFSSLEKCISSAEDYGAVDDCYILSAKETNLIDFCNDVSQERKEECYAVIDPNADESTGENLDESIDQSDELEAKGNIATGLFGLSFANSTEFPTIESEIIPFADVDQDITINANVKNAGSNAKVFVVYKNSPTIGSEGWVEEEMTLSSGNMVDGAWEGTIPLSQITPATDMPNMINNGGLENWANGNTPDNWTIGWAKLDKSEKETRPEYVAEGDSSWMLQFHPWGKDAYWCKSEDIVSFDGNIYTDPFIIDGEYLNFFAFSDVQWEVQVETNYEIDPRDPDYLLDFMTPWGGQKNVRYPRKVLWEDTQFKPRVQLIESSTGKILRDSAILSYGNMLMEYEWDLSGLLGKEVYVNIVDNSVEHTGLFVDSFLQLKKDGEGFISVPIQNANGELLDNINFEKGTLEGWTTTSDYIWRLVSKDQGGQIIPTNDKQFANNYPGDTLARYNYFWNSSGTGWGVAPLGIYTSPEKDTGYVEECTSARCYYVNTVHARTVCSKNDPTQQQIDSCVEKMLANPRTYRPFTYYDKYKDLNEGLGKYVLTSVNNDLLHRYPDAFGEGKQCYGTKLAGDGSIEVGDLGAEINIHNSWSPALIANQPYLFTYKIKTDGGVVNSQLVLGCDYVGDPFVQNGAIETNGYLYTYGIEAEARGKMFTSSRCQNIGDDWHECKSVIMTPSDITYCGNFRIVLTKGGRAGGGIGNTVWVDDFKFSPIRTGIKYYIKVVNSNGEFSNVFPDYEKAWDIDQGALDVSFRRKAVNLFAGSDAWDDYDIEFKVKEIEALGFQGYPWSVGSILFRAKDYDNYYKLNVNIGHELLNLEKIINGRGNTIQLTNQSMQYWVNLHMSDALAGVVNDWRPYSDYVPSQNVGQLRCTNSSGVKYTCPQGRVNFQVLETGQWYNIKVSVRGDNIKAFINGVLVIDETDSSISNGFVGFSGYESHMQFDDLSVTDSQGNILLQDSFNNLDNWKADARAYRRADFIATGKEKDWIKVLEVNDVPDEGNRKLHTYPFTPTVGRYVLFKVFDTHAECTNGRISDVYDPTVSNNKDMSLSKIIIDSIDGGDVAENANIIATNVYPQASIENWTAHRNITISNKSLLQSKYEPLAYYIFDLGENKDINGFAFYTAINGYRTPDVMCKKTNTALPKEFSIEILPDGAY